MATSPAMARTDRSKIPTRDRQRQQVGVGAEGQAGQVVGGRLGERGGGGRQEARLLGGGHDADRRAPGTSSTYSAHGRTAAPRGDARRRRRFVLDHGAVARASTTIRPPNPSSGSSRGIGASTRGPRGSGWCQRRTVSGRRPRGAYERVVPRAILERHGHDVGDGVVEGLAARPGPSSGGRPRPSRSRCGCGGCVDDDPLDVRGSRESRAAVQPRARSMTPEPGTRPSAPWCSCRGSPAWPRPARAAAPRTRLRARRAARR